MSGLDFFTRLTVVVGSGGVGKTTLAAALAVDSADAGRDTLVMTFDPSLRLKDTLGIGRGRKSAEGGEVRVAGFEGHLTASLLDARATFDGLIQRYAPDAEARDRILTNRYYDNLAGSLAGILEYMAVEKLYEAARESPDRRLVLDTPPTRQALDFLEAPRRIVDFLDSGALRIALKQWFDPAGHLRPAAYLGPLGDKLEQLLDEVVGLELLREMSEFFQAFGPLFEGFRRRALAVEELLASRDTLFVLVAGPGEERIPDALFFARRLEASGLRLGPVIVNRVHPARASPVTGSGRSGRSEDRWDLDAVVAADGVEILAWLGERDRRGLARLRQLLDTAAGRHPFAALPLLPEPPLDAPSLRAVAADLGRQLGGPT